MELNGYGLLGTRSAAREMIHLLIIRRNGGIAITMRQNRGKWESA
jgi:hypothetical protein